MAHQRERPTLLVFSPRVPEELTVVVAEGFHGELRSIAVTDATVTLPPADLLVEGARITRSNLGESRTVRPSLGDVVFSDCNLANSRWSEARLSRVRFRQCQMTGFDANASTLLDVEFRSCKLSLSSFRFLAKAKILFAHCEMDGTDFQGCDLRHCRFDHCVLTGSLFDQAQTAGVDLRGSTIAAVQGVSGLRGAVIDQLQLLDLTTALASHVGLVVRDEV
ncbi:MAG TPA: pentapeptide repeat-containing protein [Candidatus Micrarchaeaceae archaeon]|nr:pentapeptide repeat-containing protein [Candidatus Micrarchaeaceae archaeon]